MDGILLNFLIVFGLLTSNLNAQQKYSGNSVLDCSSPSGTGPSPDFLYSCNGERHSCQSFLIFRSQFPYNSVTAISSLTSSDPLKLAAINNVSDSEIFPSNKEVIIPVDCSCSNWYYQANSSYAISSIYDTYFNIANLTYQGLSTCSILMLENVYDKLDLKPGLKLQVPLRCACPTKNQTVTGTKFLLTYLITWDDSITEISKRFNVSASSVVYANGFFMETDVLFPFTTILIPLSTPPLSSQTIISDPQVVPPTSPYDLPATGVRNSKKGIYVGIGIGVSSAILTIFLFFCFLHHMRRKVYGFSWKGKLGKNKWVLSKEELNRITHVDQALKVYEFEEIEAGTENFSPHNRLSHLVYHGVIQGQELAIKKMGTDVSKEVNILKKINHFNLISLCGACENRGDFYLIYEYMENGCLKNWLRKNTCSEHQSWYYRIQIAFDVADGLHYLHNFTDPPYVHKDINSTNVLLSRDLRAKIANLSLARSADNGENVISLAKCALREKGYVAPEYIEAGLVTPMVDVYAFGVLLLELITGREAVFEQDGDQVFLSKMITSIVDGQNEKTDFGHLIDPRLQVKHPLGFVVDQSELALRMIKLSMACLAEEPTSRPSMGLVVSTLMRIQLDAERSENWYLSGLLEVPMSNAMYI